MTGDWTLLKKLIFQYGVAGGASYILSVITGVSPLTVTAVARAIESLSQYGKCELASKEYLDTITQEGKCEQASTPTPSAPVDIVCNNGALKYGQYGTNLFNPAYYQGYGWYISTNNTVANANANGTLVFPCKPNTTYSWWHTAGVGGARAFELTTDEVTVGQSATWAVGNPAFNDAMTVRKYTTSADAKLLCVLFARVADQVGRTIDEQLADFMLVEGDITTATPYEPYKFGFYTVGTPEVLSVGGKNLFDASAVADENRYVNSNTGAVSTPGSGEFRYSAYIPVTEGVTYFFGITPFTASAAGMAWYSSTRERISGRNGTWLGNNGMKDTAPTGAKYVRFSIRIDEGYDTNWQNTVFFCKDGDLTQYEPYRTLQTASVVNLLQVDNFADNQEVISGLVTHRVGCVVLDGTETWIDGNYGYITEAVQDQSGETYTPLCTHFRGTTGTPQGNSNTLRCYRTSGGIGRIYIAPNRTTYNTKEAFAAFLAAQYAAGTPVIVLYPLATETTESVAPQISDRNLPVTVTYTAEIDDITITTTQSVHTIPSPNTPLDILCNNGTVKAVNGQVTVDGTAEVLTVSADGAENQTATVANLFAVGDYKDVQDIISGAVKRNVGIKVLDGTESVSASGAGWAIAITDRLRSKVEILCSHYPYSSATMANAPDKSIIAFSSQNIGIKDSMLTSASAVQAFLAAQYAAGTPVIVIYPLAEEAAETVTPQALTTSEGTNIITVNSNVDPVDLKMEYYTPAA